jgi:methyltransferase family protein
MPLLRKLESEWLDQLPADDPRAIRSRRDLRRINMWMQNAGSMASALIRHAAGRQPQTIVDLGSGDGQFMLQVARLLAPRWPHVKIILHDRQNIVSRVTREGFAALQWQVETISADVFDFMADAGSARVDVITSNLFLHHFTDEQLARLFAQAAERAWLVVACEPRRAKYVVRFSRLLWVIGCNDVSIHDAVVSARAGFNGKELSALWPRQERWELHEQAAGFFTHCFASRRSTQTGQDASTSLRSQI